MQENLNPNNANTTNNNNKFTTRNLSEMLDQSQMSLRNCKEYFSQIKQNFESSLISDRNLIPPSTQKKNQEKNMESQILELKARINQRLLNWNEISNQIKKDLNILKESEKPSLIDFNPAEKKC